MNTVTNELCTDEGVRPASDVAYTYDGAGSRVLTAVDSASGETATRLYDERGEAAGQLKNGVTNRTDTTYEVSSDTLWRVTTQTAAGGTRSVASATKERLSGLSNELRSETCACQNGALALHSYSWFDATNSILTEVSESATAGATTTKSKFGIAIETTTPSGTTSNFFDPYGRVFYTEKDGRSVDWIGRNDYGDVEEYDTFHASGDNVYAEFYGYDNFVNRTSATNALGAVTVSAYDAAHRLSESSGAVYPVRHAYDTADRRTALTTFRTTGGSPSSATVGDRTAWTFDPATGFCALKTYADGSTVAYSYTPDGKLLRTTKPSGAWMENIYDATRQFVGILSSDGALDSTIQRDEFGRVVSESNLLSWTEIMRVFHVREGGCPQPPKTRRVRTRALPENLHLLTMSNTITASVAYSLDEYWGATNEVQTVDGVSVFFIREFDAYGRLTYFARIGGEESMFGYAPHGAISVVSNGNFAVAYAFTGDALDAGYALVIQGGATFTRELVRHDYLRNCIVAVSNRYGNISHGLQYSCDALQRPIARNSDSFAYNDRGEVISSRRDAENAEDTYLYDNIGNLLASSILHTSASPREMSYDLGGNLQDDGVRAFTYDAANHLKTVSTNGILVLMNFYDAKFRRARSVPSGTMRTRSASGSSGRWTPTTPRHGRRSARRTSELPDSLPHTQPGEGESVKANVHPRAMQPALSTATRKDARPIAENFSNNAKRRNER